MPAEIRTPFSRSPARQAAADTWRKRVLPIGEVEYKGRMLKFDRPYLETLAEAYNRRAYDQVPFQLADAHNTHTNDPERFRGEITNVTVEPDGLYITAKTTPEGSRLLMTNPKLGVSARIVEDYARSDGQYFRAAIQHVLGTLDPRIPQLGAWEAVEMSNVVAPDMIVDLSAATFAGEAQEGGILMPELDADKQARLAALLELDPAKLTALADGLADIDGADIGYEGEDEGELSEQELIEMIDQMSDEEFAELQAEYEIDTMGEQQPQYAGAGLANGYGMSDVELTNYQLAETQRQLSVLQVEHDAQAYENEKRTLASRYNIPPFITELARPLLEGTGHVVEMANGQGVDAGLVMRRVLQSFGGVMQGLGLDAPVELGSPHDAPGDDGSADEQARGDLVARYRRQTGI